MIDQIRSDDPIRRKIETLGTTLSLPTVRKALGILEGAHASNKRFGADDVVDIHAYEPGDEAKRIDWKTSARAGRPMVVQRERPSTSKAWLLLDVGQEMTAACPSSEQAYQVAANALCMFAALSLRRGDEVSMVFGDSASITRVPFNGGLAQFERTLDTALQREWTRPRNIDALLEYARRIRDKEALVVIATEEHALEERHLSASARLQGHIRWCSSMWPPSIRLMSAMRAWCLTGLENDACLRSCVGETQLGKCERIVNTWLRPFAMS